MAGDREQYREKSQRDRKRVKQKFYSDLQDTIDKLPQNDVLVMLGDFNAQVGVLEQGDDAWQGVLGRQV